MTNATIEAQFNALVRKADRENSNAVPYPTGYWKSVSRSGVDLGLGFYCPVCKLTILDAAGTVRHCSRVELSPTGWFARLRLKTYRIGSRKS